MELDIRLPIGLMFMVLGPLLLITGWVQHVPLTTRTGIAMLLFGLPMLLAGNRARRGMRLDVKAQARSHS